MVCGRLLAGEHGTGMSREPAGRNVCATTHAGQANQLMAELESEKANLAKLFTRWEDLEAVRAAAVI